jgi:ArsR family transcriptional regulator, arsenate/arsenite/antimonite-responsive transcriptional repressor
MMMSVDSDVLRVLADPLRLQIVRLLAVESLCTCHLTEATGARQTNLSNHLRVLRDAGLVETEACGRFTYYRLLPAGLRAVAASIAALADQATDTTTLNRKRPCA